jgi:hypothetical protein
MEDKTIVSPMSVRQAQCLALDKTQPLFPNRAPVRLDALSEVKLKREQRD